MEKKVLCWGSEKHNFPDYPKEIFPNYLNFKQVTVGDNIVLALSDEGKVFEFPFDENDKFPEHLQGPQCQTVKSNLLIIVNNKDLLI